MKKLFLIALGLAIWPPDTSATTVYCSTVTCGDYDEINSAGFCGSSFKWCKPSFQSTFHPGASIVSIPKPTPPLLQTLRVPENSTLRDLIPNPPRKKCLER